MKTTRSLTVDIVASLFAVGSLAACGAADSSDLTGGEAVDSASDVPCDPALDSDCTQDARGRWRRRRTDAGVTSTADSGVSTPPPVVVADSGVTPPPAPADSGSSPLPSSAGCDPNGPIGLQAMPGFKSAVGSLATVSGVTTLNGETLTGKKFTGAVRGHGTIKDSWIAADTFIAVQNSGGSITLEDVTIGGPATYGDLAVIAGGSGGVIMKRVRVEGYADCFRNGPFDIENSWCTTTQQSPDDHNDGYQAYLAEEANVSIRCSQIDNNKARPTAGIFHADGSQIKFDLLNLKISMNGNYCIRLHDAKTYNELPAGDSVDNGRVLRMQNIECTGGSAGYLVALPIDSWSNVSWNGSQVAKP